MTDGMDGWLWMRGICTTMSRLVFCVALLVLVPSGRCADAIYDEHLWTKGTWRDFKLQKTRDRWRVEDAPLVQQHVQALRERSCDFISAAGPGAPYTADSVSSQDEHDWIVALVDRVVAGATVFGSVCASAVEGGWKAVEQSVMKKDLPTLEGIRVLLGGVCLETVEDVVKKFSLQREEDGTDVGKWKLLARKSDEERSYEETEAVTLACDRFMHQRESEFVRALHRAGVELDSMLKRIEAEQLESARGDEGQRRMEENRCEDIHPKCEAWADSGECIHNPNYMLNYCRISCGICQGESTFEEVGGYMLRTDVKEEVEKKRAALLMGLKEELCPSTTPSATKPIQEIKYQPLLKKGEIEDVSRALYIELKDKCLLLFRGWWTYEICFYSQIRQLHYDSDAVTVETSRLIGKFTEQHVWHIRPLLLPEDEMTKFGLTGERRPYVLQMYQEGDACEAEGLLRSASLRLMCSNAMEEGPLSSNSIGATIEEPTPCQYVINVFLPLMCYYPEYNGEKQRSQE